MNSESTQGALQQLLVTMEDAQVFRNVIVASFALYALDYILTFSDEYRLVWGSRWSLGTILYTIERISVSLTLIFSGLMYFVTGLSQETSVCRAVHISLCVTAWIAVQPVAALSCLRTYALYNGSPRMRVFLYSLLGAWSTVAFICFIFIYTRSTYVVPPIKGYTCLFVMQTPPTAVYLAIETAAMVYEWTLAALALHRVVKHALLGESRLVKIMLRDGVAVIVLVSFLNAATFFLWIFTPSENALYKNLLQTPTQATGAILTCRLILNLREYGKRVIVGGTGEGLHASTGYGYGVSGQCAGVGICEKGGNLLGEGAERMVFAERSAPESTCSTSNEVIVDSSGLTIGLNGDETQYIYDHDLTKLERPGDGIVSRVDAMSEIV